MSVVAIGFFDGVHLGHQKILKGADIAVTFRNHPLTVLDAAKAPRLIMSFDDRAAAIRSCGVKEVIALDFTPELAALSPEDFLARFVRRGKDSAAPVGGRDSNRGCGILSAPTIRCGANWRFGRNGAGSPDWLRAHGVEVEVVEAAEYEGEIVSSTRIRECLSRGEIAAANAMMGRSYKVTGCRLQGKGEGRKLGYPTINLSVCNSATLQPCNSATLQPCNSATLQPCNSATLISALLPGVYEVSVDGHRAIANYGYAPTFGERAWKEPILEVHFLENDCEIPLSTSTSSLDLLSVEFIRFIRPERKFASLAELKSQIAADIAGLI